MTGQVPICIDPCCPTRAGGATSDPMTCHICRVRMHRDFIGPQNIRECFEDYAAGKITIEGAIDALDRIYKKRHSWIERL